MKLLQAIANADEVRPNMISDELKAAWVYELEGQLAEMEGVDVPENPFPNDTELSIPAPYDKVYEYYLMGKIDYANQETELYMNDMVSYNTALRETQAWWRRNHKPEDFKGWKI